MAQLWHFMRVATGHAPLPERVRQAIQAQQDSSEILVGWLQLGIVLIFAILYALSPAPAIAISGHALEPWVLGTYMAFTVTRLWLGYRRRLPDWLLYLSTVADMALLLALIWSFHLKYGQPASFYLKAPTLLYVFIFIALRALRYQVRYVLLAGLVAACGWLLMVLYAVTVDSRDPMITRDYVHYLTSNSVLLGAEFDKVISIALVTLLLAVAIGRARELLERSVSEQLNTRELARFVPGAVARQVTQADQPVQAGQGQVANATILFMDIEGFTALSESLSPGALIATLNEYFSLVSKPIEDQGGVINQYQGDALLATFNLPTAQPDHAGAAIRAALQVQAQLSKRRFSAHRALRARIGINTGTVIGGLIGTGERLSYTVHGEQVNLAARLEQLNKQFGTYILVSDATRLAAGPQTTLFSSLGRVAVRGMTTEIEVFTLADENPCHA